MGQGVGQASPFKDKSTEYNLDIFNVIILIIVD
jgi:hypothetical protein